MRGITIRYFASKMQQFEIKMEIDFFRKLRFLMKNSKICIFSQNLLKNAKISRKNIFSITSSSTWILLLVNRKNMLYTTLESWNDVFFEKIKFQEFFKKVPHFVKDLFVIEAKKAVKFELKTKVKKCHHLNFQKIALWSAILPQ